MSLFPAGVFTYRFVGTDTAVEWELIGTHAHGAMPHSWRSKILCIRRCLKGRYVTAPRNTVPQRTQFLRTQSVLCHCFRYHKLPLSATSHTAVGTRHGSRNIRSCCSGSVLRQRRWPAGSWALTSSAFSSPTWPAGDTWRASTRYLQKSKKMSPL